MLDYSQEEKEIFMSEALKEAQKSLDKRSEERRVGKACRYR